jgi:hypothetical protein
MVLIQILLPLYDNAGRLIAKARFKVVKQELTEKFHGLTAYTRSAAQGFWKEGDSTKRDDIVVYEVMASSVKKAWWRRYRKTLETRFRQESVVIRAQKTRLL